LAFARYAGGAPVRLRRILAHLRFASVRLPPAPLSTARTLSRVRAVSFCPAAGGRRESPRVRSHTLATRVELRSAFGGSSLTFASLRFDSRRLHSQPPGRFRESGRFLCPGAGGRRESSSVPPNEQHRATYGSN